MVDQVEARQEKIRECLKILARSEGVQRSDLVPLLQGELGELQKLWQIDLDIRPVDVKRAIEGYLWAAIIQLDPRPGTHGLTGAQRQKQYRDVIAMSFNLFEQPELRDLGLDGRRAWFAQNARFKVEKSTSQRDLRHAIEAISLRLASDDYEPSVVAVEAVLAPSRSQSSEILSTRSTLQLPDVPADPYAVEAGSSSRRVRWLWPAAIVVVVAFAAFVTIYIATRPSDTCGPDDPACVPYSIHVETDLNRITSGVPAGAYLFEPGSFAAETEKPSCGNPYGFQEWAEQRGGAPVGSQYVRVSITAKDKPILVDFVEVEAIHAASRSGDVASCLQGTQLDVRYLDVNTDQETTIYYSETDPQKGKMPEVLALHIAPGESEVLIVSAHATAMDASWHLKLGMDVGGERIEHDIRDPNGQDFQLAASEAAGRTMYTEVASHQWGVLNS